MDRNLVNQIFSESIDLGDSLQCFLVPKQYFFVILRKVEKRCDFGVPVSLHDMHNRVFRYFCDICDSTKIKMKLPTCTRYV